MNVQVYLLPIILMVMTSNCLPSREFSCAKRVYLSKAEQVDENGLKCWDLVEVASCAGRCDSREVSQ